MPIDDDVIGLWSSMLADVALEDGLSAARQLIATRASDWPPVVGALRQVVAERRVSSVAGETEWEQVMRAVSRFGRYRWAEAEAWLNPMTAATVRCVGWEAICNSEQIGVERAHFLRAYDAIQRRELAAANIGALEGAPYQRLGPAPPVDVPRRQLTVVDRVGPVEASRAVRGFLNRYADEKKPEGSE